uniref:non-specific serine/threonine protein kinase n=1 Tax=Tetraodon nigroviridis TaxID=99883 RepID=H3DNQ6_TETNG
MPDKIHAQQKLVQFNIISGDTEISRSANYNLRPRKRKNLIEPKCHNRKLIRIDTSNDSSSTSQHDSELKTNSCYQSCRRRPTPFPTHWKSLSEPEPQTAVAQRGGYSIKGKRRKMGRRKRKTKKVLSNSEKQTLRAVRTAAFQSKYQELYMIGCGGFGDVFAGSRIQDNLPVAIKHIPRRNVYSKLPDQNGDWIPTEVALMVKLSWETAGSAAHVRLLDWYDLFDQVILVLERPVPCIDLFHYCRHRSKPILDEDKAKVIMKQLIEEAKLFDSKGIFHRDLKLENILINTNTAEPQIWVIDFGVGCFFTKRSVYRVFQGTPQHSPSRV